MIVIHVTDRESFAEIWCTGKDWTIKVPYDDLVEWVAKNCDLIDNDFPTPENPDPATFVVSPNYYIENFFCKKDLDNFIKQYQW